MSQGKIDVSKYKDYPEGSGGKAIYDSVVMPFPEYLKKYYKETDLSLWKKWMENYINPAFDETQSELMIKNFGYVKKEHYDFETQYEIFNQVNNNSKLDSELKKFIAFMGGAGFFKTFQLSVGEWFDAMNWRNPSDSIYDGKTINEILSYPFGINFLKSSLPELVYWRR